MESIIGLIESRLPEMSKGHKAIATYILSDYDKAAYMTAAKLGEETGVSESTVVRFTMELGFEGYPHFQNALKEELKSKLTSVQRLNYTERFSDDATAIRDIMRSDMENLKRLHHELISKDWFMTLLDLKEYIETKEKVYADYENQKEWNRKCLVNIAKAGFFSSDRTIAQYNEDIWKLK